MNRIVRIRCPRDNYEEMRTREEAALFLFKSLCPAEASVCKITGIRGQGKYKCAWRVRYGRNGNEEVISDSMMRRFLSLKPNNTVIIDTKPLHNTDLLVDYSMICSCPLSQNQN